MDDKPICSEELVPRDPLSALVMAAPGCCGGCRVGSSLCYNCRLWLMVKSGHRKHSQLGMTRAATDPAYSRRRRHHSSPLRQIFSL